MQEIRDAFVVQDGLDHLIMQLLDLLLFDDIPTRRQPKFQAERLGHAVEETVERTDLKMVQVLLVLN